MTARDTRAALVLGSAVAIAVAVALFPAAFGVALPQNPLAPAPVAGDGSGGWASGPVATPPPATPTAAPAGEPPTDSDWTFPSIDADLLGRVVALALLVVVVLAVRDYRSEGAGTFRTFQRVLARASSPPVGRWLATLSRLTATALVALGAGLGRIVSDLASVVSTVLSAIPIVAGRAGSANAGTLRSASLALGGLGRAAVSATLAVFGAASRPWLPRPILGDRDAGADDPDHGAGVDPAPGATPSDGPSSVLAAWAWLESLVPITNGRARTAGEYASAAIDAGFPETPVRRLLAAFRAVRYGGRTDDGDRLTSARDALAALRGGDRE